MKTKVILVLLLPIVLIAAAAGYLYSQRETLISQKIQEQLQVLTGTPVVLESVLVETPQGSPGWTVKIKKLSIRNPSSFGSSDAAVLSNVQVSLEPMPLLSGQWKIHTISARFKEINFQADDQGIINISQMPAIQAVSAAEPVPAAQNFWAENYEIQYGKVTYGETILKLTNKQEVYRKINDPGVLIQAPVLSLINELNQGSLGLPRGKLQEHVRQHVDVQKAA